MMKNFILILLFILIIAVYTFADYPKLPVFNASYELSYDSEEDEELDEIISDAKKHTIIFKIKEELSKIFYFNLPLQLTFKDYFTEDDDYYYVRFNPYCSWKIGDKVNLKFYLIGKWFDYDMPDSDGFSKDYFRTSGQIEWSYKVTEDFKIITVLKSDYGLYVNPEKQKQTYTFRFGSSLNINQWILLGMYSEKFMFPLDVESLEEFDMINTFKVDVKWDLNKERGVD